MKTYKILEKSMDVPDTISLFTNADNNILNRLSSTLEKRCFGGCYVLKVMNVIKRSECIITQADESCRGSIDVMFNAQVLEYMPGDIVTGCKVVKKNSESGVLIASTDVCALNITTDDVFNSITVGQIVPVRARRSHYAIGNDRIQAFAEPFVPRAIGKVFNFGGYTVTDEDVAKLQNIINIINDEEDMLEDHNENEIGFFSKLVYPYNKELKLPGSQLKIIDSLKGLKLNTIVYIPDTIHDGNVNHCMPKEMGSKPLFGDKTLEQPTDDKLKALTEILTDYYQSLVLIRGLCDDYDTKELKEKHINLWRIFQNSKV